MWIGSIHCLPTQAQYAELSPDQVLKVIHECIKTRHLFMFQYRLSSNKRKVKQRTLEHGIALSQNYTFAISFQE